MIKIYPLELEHNRNIYIDTDKIKVIVEEIENILLSNPRLIKEDFLKRGLFNQELQANNLIEGYVDNLDQIEKLTHISDNRIRLGKSFEENQLRIINLYRAYKEIVNIDVLDENKLKELYQILSFGLLKDFDKLKKGQFYRNDEVFIQYTNNPNVEYDRGIDKELIKEKMDSLLDFLNEDEDLSMLDAFIKSQVAHFYFVYIHPYFDVNGRTARTVNMWYLIKNKAEPFIIFNRGILLNKQKYYKVIRSSKYNGNVTAFIKYMLEQTSEELKKENTILKIEEKLGTLDTNTRQALNYVLSMNGKVTRTDFTNMYARFNPKEKNQYIDNNILNPLFEKGILIKGKSTKSKNDNYFFTINEELLEKEEKAKVLTLAKK